MLKGHQAHRARCTPAHPKPAKPLEQRRGGAAGGAWGPLLFLHPLHLFFSPCFSPLSFPLPSSLLPLSLHPPQWDWDLNCPAGATSASIREKLTRSWPPPSCTNLCKPKAGDWVSSMSLGECFYSMPSSTLAEDALTCCLTSK